MRDVLGFLAMALVWIVFFEAGGDFLFGIDAFKGWGEPNSDDE
jgi:hypothetical protein